MAAASLTVISHRGELRKYGGNRSHVRAMHYKYKNMTLVEFLNQHGLADDEDYRTLKLEVRYNKN